MHPGLGEAAAEQAAPAAMREARITARLQHPHAIPVYDVVEHDRPALPDHGIRPVTQPAKTCSRRHTTLGVDEVAAIGSQIAAALSAAHRAGIVHRDGKQGDVLPAKDQHREADRLRLSSAFGDVTVTTTGNGHRYAGLPRARSSQRQSRRLPRRRRLSPRVHAIRGARRPPTLRHARQPDRNPAPRCLRPRDTAAAMRTTDTGDQRHVAAQSRKPAYHAPGGPGAISIAAAGGVAPAASHLLVSPSQQTQQLTLSANPPTGGADATARDAAAAVPNANPPRTTRGWLGPPPTPPGIAHRRRRGHPAGPERCSSRTRHPHQRRRQDHRKLVDNGTALDCEVRDATRRRPRRPSLRRPRPALLPQFLPLLRRPRPPRPLGARSLLRISAAAAAPSTGADAIDSYYSLVPNNLSDAWAEFSGQLPEKPAGGMDAISSSGARSRRR